MADERRHEDRRVCDFHDAHTKMITDIHAAIVGNVEGREGIVSKVNGHGRQLAAITRLAWLFVGALVVAGVAIIQADVLK
jgi:hypothetical protein